MDPEFREHPGLPPAGTGPRARLQDFRDADSPLTGKRRETEMEVLHPQCAGLDVHQKTVVACVRLAIKEKVVREVRTFGTTTSELLALADWLAAQGCTHVAMESTGVYGKPVWHV